MLITNAVQTAFPDNNNAAACSSYYSEYIERWSDIYSGRPPWETVKKSTLTGKGNRTLSMLNTGTVGGRGAVKITVVDVFGTHTSYVYDGDALTRTSQLTNDSGFVARKSGVPYNVIAVPGANSAVLVWEKVTGAAKYRIQRLNNGTWGTIAYSTANSYRATGLTAGTEYAYRVLASMDGTTWGSASEAAYVTPFSVVSATSISEISETPSDEFEGEEVTI